MVGLESEFDQAMFEIYRRAKQEAHYTATIFLQMLNDGGGLLTAKKLINAQKPSAGYTSLWERQRLDLTVEAVVVEHVCWHPLFTPEEIERARQRLIQYGYQASLKSI